MLLDQLRLPLLCRLLRVDEHAALFDLVRAAATAKRTLPQLVLSLARRDGLELGPEHDRLLRRAERRAAEYSEILSAIHAARASVRVVKGGSLARIYPPGVMRPVGDLDVWAASEQDVWKAAAVLTAMRPDADVDLVLHGRPRPSPLLTVLWPLPNGEQGKAFKAEIFSSPFNGNAREVTTRYPRISDSGPHADLLADLLALCEEGFQRSFNPKDVADVLALADAGVTDPDVITDLVAENQLAPEFEQMLDYAAAYCDIGPYAEVLARVRTVARRERDRRAAWTWPSLRASIVHPVRKWLELGVPTPGALLRRRHGRASDVVAEIEESGPHLLYRCPVGDYLVTTHTTVPRADYEAAMLRLDR